MSAIHPTAIVAAGAKLGAGVKIGPFSVVGDQVELGDGVVLHNNVTIAGRTTIGARCEVFPFACLGHKPQDLKFKGEPSELVVGTDTQIREYVTMHPGTTHGGMLTSVGSHCLLMVASHVAHDCRVGDHVIMANQASLAGHVTVGDRAILGGLAAVLQFTRIGHHAMIGGVSAIRQDVIPFGLAVGASATLGGLNLVGLKRAEVPREQILGLQQAYQQLFQQQEATLLERAGRIEAQALDNPLIRELVDFVRADSAHGIMQPRGND